MTVAGTVHAFRAAPAGIVLDGVSKDFVVHRRIGRVRERVVVRAVDSLTLAIGEGEMVGYIGPNGAGKSTTIKMLTGILVPTEGQVRVAGLDPQRHRIQTARRVGVVFGQRSQLWWDLPLRDSFDLLRHVYRVAADRHRANLASFVDLLELGPFLDTPVRQLSLGQRMRGEITAALLHDPAVLYLDEPTIGLDVVSTARVREVLTEVNQERGTTVVLTTHDLDNVEQLCSRLVVIDRGRILHDGTVAAVKARFAPYRTVIVDLVSPDAVLDVPNATVVRAEGRRRWVRFHRDEASAAQVIASIVAVAEVVDLSVEEPDIEDVVRTMYLEVATT